jgi:multidrug efflux pump subunit AcrB
LLIGRYQEEKSRGQLPREAMVTAISRIGRAIVTTAMTTLGGFAILIASDLLEEAIVLREQNKLEILRWQQDIALNTNN